MGRARRIGTGGLVGLLLALGLVATAPPVRADAWALSSSGQFSPPMTWVDDQDRQYVLSAEWTADTASQTFVDRVLPDGTADATWGTDGHLPVSFAAPAPDLFGRGMSVDDGGVLTALWAPSPCPQPDCPLTFARYQPDGTPVGTAVTAGSATALVRSLSDGSFVMRTSGGALRWFGPTGTDRGAPQGLGEVLPRSVAVDHAGRLLVATAGAVVRWPVGGPATTVATVTCPFGQPPSVGGAATDDGFATVCRAGTDVALTVRRHGADGAVAWTTTETTPGTHLEHADAVQVDGAGRVWAGGRTLTPPIDIGIGTYGIGVSAFGPTGPLAGGTTIAITDQQGLHSAYAAITDLRAAGTSGVVYGSMDDCCQWIEGPDHRYTSITAGRFPIPPAAPAGHAEHVTIEAADESSVDVAFGPASRPEAGREPTGYRVEADGPAGTATATTGAVPVGPALHAHLGGLTGGKAVTVTVIPFNDLGDTTDPTAADPLQRTATVLPFATVGDFVSRQYADLAGTAPPPLPSATFDQLADGTTDPAQFAADLLATGRATHEVEPVARLYRAYFLRDPDRAGLAYWVGRRHNGAKLTAISDQFARSSEFTRRYGSLTNRAFVDALYRNVFGRAPDASGLAFWSGRLDRRVLTRGQVVLQFSESSEDVRRSAPRVQPLATAYLLLGRLPSPAERAAWLVVPSPRHDVTAAIFATHEYALRVTTALP